MKEFDALSAALHECRVNRILYEHCSHGHSAIGQAFGASNDVRRNETISTSA